MRVAILDDWFDTLRTLPCFDKLSAHEVTVFHDHVEDVDLLASRLAAFEALVLIRERTEIRAPLLERLTRLRLMVGGQVLLEDGEHTGALPGSLVRRGYRAAP